jgi:hypothetical protein
MSPLSRRERAIRADKTVALSWVRGVNLAQIEIHAPHPAAPVLRTANAQSRAGAATLSRRERGDTLRDSRDELLLVAR